MKIGWLLFIFGKSYYLQKHKRLVLISIKSFYILNDSEYASAIGVFTTLAAVITMPLMVLLFQSVI